jgi:DNA mismatch repair protein MutL
LSTPRVERLPDDLINKIAAGQVVDRPASVVKELIENALDAGARSVRIEIEAGGKSRIRVVDDGHGMDRANAERALERHATSKLRRLEDLQRIGTHGFRGEALPAIGSVARLWLRTRREGEGAGTEIEVHRGRLLHVRDAGHPVGTSVEVNDLFAGMPGRLKFLKAESTEAGHVAEAVTLAALAHPKTAFFLESRGRSIVQAPPALDLAGRLYQLFGGAFLDELLPVDDTMEWARVCGFVSRPDGRRPARPSLRLFVNGRPIRDRAVSRAAAEAYRRTGSGEQPFEAVLFLETPLEMVDVNVHPTKAEVRFADGRTVFAAVERAVGEALSRGTQRRAPRADTTAVTRAVESFLAHGVDRVGEDSEPFGPPAAASASSAGHSPSLFASEPPVPSLLAEGPPTVLGQYRNTYLLATDGEDLLLVDQHTAHERVRFEELRDRLDRRAVESQMLLTPVVVTLPPALRATLESATEPLLALGYDVEPFGGGEVRLRAVPALLPVDDPGRRLEAILRDLLEREAAGWVVSEPMDRVAATLACHSAVRAGQALAPAVMAAIVRDLGRTAHPTLCPHGRPTLVRVPREEISRWFGRTGWRRQ